MGNKRKKIQEETIHRLIIAKSLIDSVCDSSISEINDYQMAKVILLSHDTTEIVLAAIAYHNDIRLKERTYFMDYFDVIKREINNGKEMPERTFFNRLNHLRIDLKHKSIFPNPQKNYRIAEDTREYLKQWYDEFFGIQYDGLDESALLVDTDAKQYYDQALHDYNEKNYQKALESLSFALSSVFYTNWAFPDLVVGTPNVKDALKLSSFGIHPYEFLSLQEYLPRTNRHSNEIRIQWNEFEYDHPANWNAEAVEFCLKVFLKVAIRVQYARWIPRAIEFDSVYEYEITAKEDNVEVFQGSTDENQLPSEVKRRVISTLEKNESIRAYISNAKKGMDFLSTINEKVKQKFYHLVFLAEPYYAYVEIEKVRVKCVPRDDEYVKKFFPSLPKLKYSLNHNKSPEIIQDTQEE